MAANCCCCCGRCGEAEGRSVVEDDAREDRKRGGVLRQWLIAAGAMLAAYKNARRRAFAALYAIPNSWEQKVSLVGESSRDPCTRFFFVISAHLETTSRQFLLLPPLLSFLPLSLSVAHD